MRAIVEFRNKRTQTKEHNRRVILDAARGVFGRRGYRTATVRDIIGATSLASGTFYNYFKSKEEVYAALRDEIALEVRPLLRAERYRAQTADELVAGTFRAFLSHVTQGPASLAAIDAPADDVSSGVRSIVMGGDDLRRDIQTAIERGLLADVDAELLAAAIVGVAFEVAEVMRQRKQTDADEAARFCSELILRGLGSLPVAHGAASSARV
jgi:AcrR family transcriptional regulator